MIRLVLVNNGNMMSGATLGAARIEAQRRKKKSTFKLDDIEQELAWRRWFPQDVIDWSVTLDDEQADMLFDAAVDFIESNVLIKVPGRGKIPFRLRDAQKDVLWHWIKDRYSVALKARQIGYSTLAGAYSLWLTFGWSDRLIVMLSKGERESVSLLLKAKVAYKNLPDWVRLRGPKPIDKVSQKLSFDNDSAVWSLPSANDPARGESVFTVFVDEWAFLPNPEEAWASIEPITDIGGRVVGISTAKGEGNFFHRLWLGSQTHTNDFAGIFHGWDAVDERDEAWHESKKRSLEPWQLAQEYPSTPDEAFVGSGNPVFNTQNLRRFSSVPYLEKVDIRAPLGRRHIDIVSGGNLTIWETPDDENGSTYVVGADIAEGLEHGDFTVAYVMCVQTNQIVGIWHGKIDPDVFGFEVLPALGWYYRYAVVAPEVNNHGLTVLKALQRAGYGRIFRRRSFAKRQDRPLETMGWLTTHTSKPLLVDELAAYLRDDAINIPDDGTIAELRSFSRDANGKMSGQPHDDRVMALGITVQARKYAIQAKVDTADDPSKIKGSFAWWEKKLGGKGSDRKRLQPCLV